MSIKELGQIASLIWEWYPKFWSRVIPDDPFRVQNVSRWRTICGIAMMMSLFLGWSTGPLITDGKVDQLVVAAFGSISLLTLVFLSSKYPLDFKPRSLKLPAFALALYFLMPYLWPWGAYRFNKLINSIGNWWISFLALGSDPSDSLIDGIINFLPYAAFLLLAIIYLSRRYKPEHQF